MLNIIEALTPLTVKKRVQDAYFGSHGAFLKGTHSKSLVSSC